MSCVALTRHPCSDCEAVHRVEARVHVTPRKLALNYSVEGDIEAIFVPEARPSRRADRLWQTTCFEVFLKDGTRASAYYEFNFSPSGEWAIYRFDAYRKGLAVVDDCRPPEIRMSRGAKRLVLNTLIDLDKLPAIGILSEPRLALSSVIEEKSGKLSYWACVHPSGKPDFHHEAGFTLTPDHVRAAY